MSHRTKSNNVYEWNSFLLLHFSVKWMLITLDYRTNLAEMPFWTTLVFHYECIMWVIWTRILRSPSRIMRMLVQHSTDTNLNQLVENLPVDLLIKCLIFKIVWKHYFVQFLCAHTVFMCAHVHRKWLVGAHTAECFRVCVCLKIKLSYDILF